MVSPGETEAAEASRILAQGSVAIAKVAIPMSTNEPGAAERSILVRAPIPIANLKAIIERLSQSNRSWYRIANSMNELVRALQEVDQNQNLSSRSRRF
ncbi:MAG: hypothetical protein HY692_04535 [Cyanobacteria bacterium NC_groundwater_1444_Ag_S-0.65um_54_12]|nr:hypothetical protein [Cyanobacteria bacterium NC_groundwater_1444_Ag_S-0.65um_54_12]